jgi:hypothetical protein
MNEFCICDVNFKIFKINNKLNFFNRIIYLVMVSANKRREKDVMKLLVSEYDVQLINENTNSEFIVKFAGPKDSAYEGVS